MLGRPVRLLRWFTALILVALHVAPAAATPTLLLEASTGRVLYSEDFDDQWHPASLTKIMTAYITFRALKSGKATLETQIPYSEAASVQPPSKIGLPVGATVSLDTALQALIVKSANDIAVALAEAIGGSEAQFVEVMNATAKSLGMTRTVFRNPHGLPAAEQVTTARDLARLSMAVLRDFPEYAHYWSLTQMQVGNVRIVSHNSLFKTLEGWDGLKTGFICDSGYNIVATATREGTRLIAVVLGQSSAAERNIRAQALLEHGHATLGWKVVFGANDTISNMPLAQGAKDASSIRESVVAMECNNRRIARVAAAARKRAKARAKTEQAAAKAPDKAAAVAPQQKASAGAQKAAVAPSAAATPKPAAAAAAPRPSTAAAPATPAQR